MTLYLCKACGKTTKRDPTKAWILSYCCETGKDVRLTRVRQKSAQADRAAGSKATKAQ